MTPPFCAFAIGFAQRCDDQCRLRETAATPPTRADRRDMKERLSERIEALATRIDGLVERGEV